MVPRSSLIPLCALSILAGCGASTSGSYAAVHFDPCQPLAVMPDPGITSDQRQAITDGIALWNLAALAHLTVGDAAASGADPTLPLHYQSAAAPFHGLYDDRVGEVFINDDLSAHPRVVTIAHEVGHSFGLVHIPGSVRPSVMNPGNLVNEPTAEDVAGVAALWGRCP